MTRENSKRLFQILLEADQLKLPSVPDHCRAITIHPDVNEKGIKKNLKQFCEAVGLKYTDTNSSATRSVQTETLKHASGVDRQKVTTHWKKSGLEKGHHDCEVSRNNRLWSIEIKAVNKKKNYKDKQSDVQREFERKLKDKYGNDYYIIRGIDDFMELYDNEICSILN